MEPKYTVYCHTHIASGRRYVGVTKHTMMHRWNQHVSQAGSSKGGRWHFPNAIRKYGKDAFEHDVIGVYDTLEEANEIEQKKIDEWDLRNPEKGFNLAKGGKHKPHPFKNPWDRPEYREKLDAIAKARWQDSEYRKKAEAAAKARWQDPECREKYMAAAKARWESPEYRAKASAASKKTWSDPDRKASLSASMSEEWKNPSLRERLSVSLKKKWQDSEYRATVSASSKEVMSRSDVKAKLRQASLGKKASAETRTRVSAASKQRWQDPDYRAKMGEIAKSRWEDPEYRNRQIEDKRAYKPSMQALANQHAAQSTPEHRARQSEATKQVWNRPGFKERQSEAHKGKSPSLATREKLRLSSGKFEMDGDTIVAKLCRKHGRVSGNDFRVRKVDGDKIMVVCLKCSREYDRRRSSKRDSLAVL